jgi:hypothetical protein
MGKIAREGARDAKNPFAVDIWQRGVYNKCIKVVLLVERPPGL